MGESCPSRGPGQCKVERDWKFREGDLCARQTARNSAFILRWVLSRGTTGSDLHLKSIPVACRGQEWEREEQIPPCCTMRALCDGDLNDALWWEMVTVQVSEVELAGFSDVCYVCWESGWECWGEAPIWLWWESDSDQGWLQSLGLNTWRAQHLWDMEVCSRTGELTWLYLNLSIFLCYTKWGSYQTWGAAV